MDCNPCHCFLLQQILHSIKICTPVCAEWFLCLCFLFHFIFRLQRYSPNFSKQTNTCCTVCDSGHSSNLSPSHATWISNLPSKRTGKHYESRWRHIMFSVISERQRRCFWKPSCQSVALRLKSRESRNWIKHWDRSASAPASIYRNTNTKDASTWSCPCTIYKICGPYVQPYSQRKIKYCLYLSYTTWI